MQEIRSEATLLFCIGNVLRGFVWLARLFEKRIYGKCKFEFSHWSEIQNIL